jgi:hypothetical protein
MCETLTSLRKALDASDAKGDRGTLVEGQRNDGQLNGASSALLHAAT